MLKIRPCWLCFDHYIISIMYWAAHCCPSGGKIFSHSLLSSHLAWWGEGGLQPGSVAAQPGKMVPAYYQLPADCERVKTCWTISGRSRATPGKAVTNMKRIVPLLVFACLLGDSHLVYLSEDGGYRDIVVKISDTLDMKKCSNIISGIKVRKCSLLVVNIPYEW